MTLAGATMKRAAPPVYTSRLCSTGDERRKQRMRLERARFQFGMELHADEPGMVLIFDDLRQHAVGRHAGEAHAVLLEPVR
jgi:hypothetical protein